MTTSRLRRKLLHDEKKMCGAIDAVILSPVQTACYLIVYEGGGFDRAGVMKLGAGMVTLLSWWSCSFCRIERCWAYH